MSHFHVVYHSPLNNSKTIHFVFIIGRGRTFQDNVIPAQVKSPSIYIALNKKKDYIKAALQ